VPLSRPQNQHLNHVICCATWHRTSCIYTHFWKCVVSDCGSSREAMWVLWVLHVFYWLNQHVYLWYFTNS